MTLLRSNYASLIALHVLFYAGFAFGRNWFVVIPYAQVLVLGILLVWISVVDVDRMEIPDLAAALLALTGAVFAHADSADALDRAIAGFLWPALFWAVGTAYARLRGWQGLGFGDVKLMVGIGLWLGLADATLVVFAAAVAGIATIVAAKLTDRHSFVEIGTTAVAFGPFICLSAWIIWLF